jgi:MFS family permease
MEAETRRRRRSFGANVKSNFRSSVVLASVVTLTFFGYFAVGMPLAALPNYVSHGLKLNAFWAGVAVSTQYIATIASRAQVGQLVDRFGPKRAVTLGFLSYLLAGVLTVASVPTQGHPQLSLGLILAGRLALGIGESWVGTGAISWAIALFGAKDTVRIISWNGIATNAALALGAPLGAWLDGLAGFSSIGVATVGLALIGLALTLTRPAAPAAAGRSTGTGQVFRIVAPYGFALALAGSGFGVIVTFVALFFGSRGWSGGSFALTAFGLAFVANRLVLTWCVTRFGGMRVARAALLIELAGLIVLVTASGPAGGIAGAALIGIGFAAVFPALGGEAVNRAPPPNRGVALGLYTVFQDASLGATGPIAGLLATRFGYSSPFLLAAAAVLGSFALCLWLKVADAA